jgi:protein-S-isoprenylcysteine O-methyltransferase Ste14
VLIVVIIAAPVRLLAFKQLGENFTFRLAKPKALVKTGMYAYVQHPSYPTIWLLSMVNFALFLRRDGIVGCVLPHWVVTWGLGMGSGIVWSTLLLEAGILGILGIVVRVKDEEAMLRKEFGSEWEAWHKKTMRFIPGVI